MNKKQHLTIISQVFLFPHTKPSMYCAGDISRHASRPGRGHGPLGSEGGEGGDVSDEDPHYGLTECFLFFSKDVRLPVQLQRAMAAEAEAAREARAKVRTGNT